MGEIDPKVERHLDGKVQLRNALRPFLQDFSVTHAAEYSRFGSTVDGVFLKPASHMLDAFGFAKEILLVYSGYREVQARLFQIANAILEDPKAAGRVEPLLVFLVSPAGNLLAAVKRQVAENREARLLIPFVLKECEESKDPFFVRGRMQEHLFTRDLFDIQLPLTSDAYYFGRNSLLLDIRDSVVSGENVGIFGLRKTGKTSLLFKLKRVLEKDDAGRVHYLDLQDAALYSLRWWELLDRLRSELGTKAGPATSSESRAAAALRKAIAAEKNSSVRHVFVLDEIEHIAPRARMRPHWDQDFLAGC